MAGAIENETSELNGPDTGPGLGRELISLLRNVSAVSSVVILVCDPEAGTCWYAGKDGPGHPQPVDESLQQVFHAEDIAAIHAYLDNVADGSHGVSGALHCLFHKPGSDYWTQGALKASVLKYRTGKLPLLLIAAEEERYTDNDLSAEEDLEYELYREAERTMHFGTYKWDLKDDTLVWSDGLYKMFGREPDALQQLSYKTYMGYVLPEDRDKLNEAVANVLQHNIETDVEYRIQAAEGEVKTVCTILRVVYDTYGAPVKIVGTTRDITPVKTAEEQLAHHLEELSRSNKELEEFAYVASHDLQEPLRKISTFTDRIVGKYNDQLDDEGRLYLKRIIASTQNMRLLIDNLLEFSRITRQPDSYTPTNLGVVIGEVRKDLDLIIEETGTVLHIGKMPVVEAIPGQMKQLFTNLLSNAIKFRKENIASVIDIGTAIVSDEEKTRLGLLHDKVYHSITITDNGIGFEDEYAIRIFQIFQRLHGKSEYPGTGIGLAICKKIAEHHKGAIFAENIPQQGARFTVVLPEQQK